LDALRRREPDFGRLEELVGRGVERYEARTGERLTWRQIGPRINHSTALMSGMLVKHNRPGMDILRDLADLFDDQREPWLEAGGFDLSQVPTDRGYTTIERDLIRRWHALSARDRDEVWLHLDRLSQHSDGGC
jgi:hypothetical protein